MSSADQTTLPRFANVTEAYGWLEGHINYERRLDRVRYDRPTFELDTFRRLLERLDNPHRGIPSVHIAGTRGKGSCGLMLEALLRASDLSVATYSSPHIHEFRERIRIDGRPIEGVVFCRALETAAALRESSNDERTKSFKTVFEYLTAVYFLASRQADADWRVVETGLGGRLDATNVLDPGPVVLTRIGLDHTHLLGGTIEEIAGEKAAILKAGGWGVVGRQDEAGEAWEVFRKRAAEIGSELQSAETVCPLVSARYDSKGMTPAFLFEGGEIELRLAWFGPFLVENLQTALAMFSELRRRGLAEGASTERMQEALTSITLPARMEPLWWGSDGAPTLLADTGHCPTAAGAVAATMDAHFAGSTATALVGMMADKDHTGFFERLSAWPGWLRVICYTPDLPRAESAETLAAKAAPFFSSVAICPNLHTALESASESVEEGSRIVAVGSIYSIGAIEDWSREHDRRARRPPQGPAQTHAQAGPGDPGA